MTLRNLLWALPVAAALASPASCTKDGQARGRPQVTVYMYSEYIDPDLLTEFQARTGITVRLDVYETTEDMMAKVRQSPGQYDVLVVSNEAIPVLVKSGLIRPLDLGQIPGAANVSPQFSRPPYDPEGRYSLPYQWGTVGLVYRKDRLGDMEPTWAVLLDPARQPGPVVLMDSMRDMMGAALIYNGHSANSRDPEEVRAASQTVIQAKTGKVLGFDGGVGGLKKVLAGDAWAAMAYNGDPIREADENVRFVLPKEGSIIWVDAMTVTAAARNPEGACKFINFILDPEIGARLSNFNHYATPNAAAMPGISQADRENPAVYPTAEMMQHLQYLEDVGSETLLYDQAWTRVKARQ